MKVIMFIPYQTLRNYATSSIMLVLPTLDSRLETPKDRSELVVWHRRLVAP